MNGFQLNPRNDATNFFFSCCRVSQKQRPHPPEVLLPAHQDPDLHPLHWGVHLRQWQGHWIGLFWWLRGEGDYRPSTALVSVSAFMLFSFLFLPPEVAFQEQAFVLCQLIGKITFVRWETKETKISSDSFFSLCSLSSSCSFSPLIKSSTRAPR